MATESPTRSVAEPLAISVPEAAQRLGISRAHAFDMATAGILPTVRFGKRLVVPIAALERVLEGETAR